MCSRMWFLVCGSNPSVGSSRKRIFGWCKSPLAISNLLFIPPENFLTWSSFLSQRSTNLRSSSILGFLIFFGTLYKRPWKFIFSYAVNSSSRLGSWNTIPKDLLIWSFSLRSCPLILTAPLVGCNIVVNIFIVVDFPAPLGPRNAKISPFFTWKEISSTATIWWLNFFVRCLISIIINIFCGIIKHTTQNMLYILLLVSQGFDRFEFGSFICRIYSKNNTHQHRKSYGHEERLDSYHSLNNTL